VLDSSTAQDRGMDLLLVESDARRSQTMLGLLAHGTQRVVQMGETPLSTGAFWPRHELTSAVLLGFDTPTMEKVRVLKRLWSADCAPPSFLVTTPGSPGEDLLCQLLCGDAIRGDWGVRGLRPGTTSETLAAFHVTGRLRLRAVSALSLERLMAMERVLARASIEQRLELKAPA